MTKKHRPNDGIPPESLLAFGQNDVIFSENEAGTAMYIIQQGAVEILHGDGDGARRIDLLHEGDFFGEESVLGETTRPTTARASTACRLLKIEKSEFELTLHAKPEVAFHMLRKFSLKLRELTLAKPRGRVSQESAAGATQPVPDLSAQLPRTRPRLVHEPTGLEFPLTATGESVVGRADADSGSIPDIDLTPTEDVPSISRRHAEIKRRNDRFFVTEEVASTNGSWVNSDAVKPGKPLEVKPGDEVQFGRVKLRFLS